MNLTKVALLFSKGNKAQFDMSSAEQRNVLERLGDPKDDIDRSLKQYLCQMSFMPAWKKLGLNMLAIAAFPLEVLYYFVKGIKTIQTEPVEAAAIFKEVEAVIPEELKKRYAIKSDCTFDEYSLSFSDLSFISYLLFRGLLHPFFVLKSTANVAKYSSLIKRYRPKCVMVHAEFAFSSSLLTRYCHSKGVEHINVMHGEKLYYIRDSFFHYDECFVWDQYYIDLFTSLKAEPSQFRIAVPKSMVIDVNQYLNESLFADYKYYLARCTPVELESIVNSMHFVRNIGKTVKFRPHPRWTDMSLLESLVPKEEIEYPAEVNIMQSVANSSYAVGSYTTVLTQAVHSGRGVVLDDITYKEQYEKLKDLKYILSNKGYPTLSELQAKGSVSTTISNLKNYA